MKTKRKMNRKIIFFFVNGGKHDIILCVTRQVVMLFVPSVNVFYSKENNHQSA